jgi:hypothetical protein
MPHAPVGAKNGIKKIYMQLRLCIRGQVSANSFETHYNPDVGIRKYIE